MWTFFGIVFLLVPSYIFSQETDDCKCVVYYLCDPKTNFINTDGGGIIVFGERSGGACTCTCPNGQVCCRLKNSTTTLTTPEPEVPTTTIEPSVRGPTIEPQQPSTSCGVRNPDGVGYKSGGDTADTTSDEVLLGEFPWFVDILVDSGAIRCGASLIHPSVVLTAAHCVVRKRTYTARAGDWDHTATNEILKHQDRVVSSIKIHENYNPAVYYNDIALLFLNGSFDLKAEHIRPACLAPSDASFGTERCYVIGRGKDDKGQYRNIPKKVDLPLVEKNTCQTKLRQTKLTGSFNLYRSFLCAGGEKDKDSCLGDGGGPLVCPIAGEEDRYQQVGIVSWGIGCHEDVPGVYTNVQFLREWIDKEMKKKKLDINHYIYSV